MSKQKGTADIAKIEAVAVAEAKEKQISQEVEPDWFRDVRASYYHGEAHVFGIEFNVNDVFADGAMRLTEYITRKFVDFEIIAIYNRVTGIRFARKHMEKIASDLLFNGSANTAASQMAGSTGGECGGMQEPSPIDSQGVAPSPVVAYPILDQLLHLPGKTTYDEFGNNVPNPDGVSVCVIIENAEMCSPNGDPAMLQPEDRIGVIQFDRWARDGSIYTNGHICFLISRDPMLLHSSLRAPDSGIHHVEIPLPGYEDRLHFINTIIPDADMEITKEEFAARTSGCTLVNLRELAFASYFKGEPINRESIQAKRSKTLKEEFREAIEIRDPRFGFDALGGKHELKAHTKKTIADCFGNPVKSKSMNMGAILAGPAGTGKTVFLEALAFESGVNFMLLNPGQLKRGIVGETEALLQRVIRVMERNSPLILGIDEGEKHLQESDYNGDSGVHSGIIATLQNFLADESHRGMIFAAIMTNYPEKLAAAMARVGRFDEIWPFLLPDAEEIFFVLEVTNREFLPDRPLSEKARREIAARLDGWTHAEIKRLSLEARRLIDWEAAKNVTEAYNLALDDIIPNTRDVEQMTLNTLASVNKVSLLPEKYRDKVRNRKALQEEIDRIANPQLSLSDQMKSLKNRENRF